MSYKETYNYWLNNPYFDDETKKELIAISGNEKEIEDRFYKVLEFGTGGMRGLIGAGTNRINKYIIRKRPGLPIPLPNSPVRKRKALLLPMTAVGSQGNSLWNRLWFSLQMVSKPICLTACAQHLSFPSR